MITHMGILWDKKLSLKRALIAFPYNAFIETLLVLSLESIPVIIALHSRVGKAMYYVNAAIDMFFMTIPLLA